MNKAFEAKATCGSRTGLGATSARFARGFCLFAAGFALGILVGAFHFADRPEASGPNVSGTEPVDDTVEALLMEVNMHLRELVTKHERLDVAARQDRIAYNLLRERGYPDDSIECTRLVNRQKQYSAAISSIEQQIEDAERLQHQLHELLDHAAAPGVLPALPPDVVAEIRRRVVRMRSETAGSAIPDERWSGGPDLLMHVDQQQDP